LSVFSAGELAYSVVTIGSTRATLQNLARAALIFMNARVNHSYQRQSRQNVRQLVAFHQAQASILDTAEAL
jgi:hypothetical protein